LTNAAKTSSALPDSGPVLSTTIDFLSSVILKTMY